MEVKLLSCMGTCNMMNATSNLINLNLKTNTLYIYLLNVYLTRGYSMVFYTKKHGKLIIINLSKSNEFI